MKKIFTFMMLLMMCANLSATTTVLFEGNKALNWSDGIDIAGATLGEAVAGDVITITTQNGGCKLSINYPWETIAESSETTTQYTIAADKLDAIKGSGIKIQGSEDVNLLKVELSSVAPEPAKKEVVATLLDVHATIGNWDNTIEIEGKKFAEVKEGDYLRINYTTTADAQLQLCANSPAWHNILNCIDLNASKTAYDLQLTADMITDITTDKLYIQGKNITISSVQIVREVTAGIQAIQIKSEADKGIYSIDGKQLQAKPQHGVYIMNGKKYMAR